MIDKWIKKKYKEFKEKEKRHFMNYFLIYKTYILLMNI